MSSRVNNEKQNGTLILKKETNLKLTHRPGQKKKAKIKKKTSKKF